MPSDLDERDSYFYSGLSSSKGYASFQKLLHEEKNMDRP